MTITMVTLAASQHVEITSGPWLPPRHRPQQFLRLQLTGTLLSAMIQSAPHLQPQQLQLQPPPPQQLLSAMLIPRRS